MIGSNYRMSQRDVSNDVIAPSQPNPTTTYMPGPRTAPQSGYLPNNPPQSSQYGTPIMTPDYPNNPPQSTPLGKAPIGYHDPDNLGSPAATGYSIPLGSNNPPSYPQSLPDNQPKYQPLQSLPDNPIHYPTLQRMPDTPDRPVYDYMGTTPEPLVPKNAAGAQLQSKQIQQLASAVAQAIQKNPQQGEAIMSQIAQEYGEDVAEQIAQMLFGDQTEAYKKGGKLKTKKAGCGCKVLKRMGGRIVEVDSCSGMPIRRFGGKVGGLIDKKEPGGPLTSYGWAVALSKPEEKIEEEEITKHAYPVIGLDKLTGEVKLLGRTDNPYQFNAFELGMVNGWKTGIFPAYSSDPTTSYVATNGDTFTATTDPNTGLISAVVPQGGERTNAQVTVQDSAALPIENNPELAAVKTDVTARLEAAAEEAKKKQLETEQKKSAFRGVFDAAGLSEYQSFAARKKFIADNKAWLHTKGFNVNNYTGSPEQNKALIKLLKEYKANPAANIAMRVVDGEPEYLVNSVWVDRDMLSPAELQRALDQNTQAPYATPNATLSIIGAQQGSKLKR